jgi:hypothetical protein
MFDVEMVNLEGLIRSIESQFSATEWISYNVFCRGSGFFMGTPL